MSSQTFRKRRPNGNRPFVRPPSTSRPPTERTTRHWGNRVGVRGRSAAGRQSRGGKILESIANPPDGLDYMPGFAQFTAEGVDLNVYGTLRHQMMWSRNPRDYLFTRENRTGICRRRFQQSELIDAEIDRLRIRYHPAGIPIDRKPVAMHDASLLRKVGRSSSHERSDAGNKNPLFDRLHDI